MTRTNKKPDDPLHRLTGSASHEAAHETGIDPVEAGEALEADAAMAEADEAVDGAAPDMPESAATDLSRWRGDSAAAGRGPRTTVPEFSEAPTVAIGRATVAPPPMESPFPGSPFFGATVARRGDGSGDGSGGDDARDVGGDGGASARESYDELLGDMGEPAEQNPRSVGASSGWEQTLRRFGQGAMWALPLAAVCLALSGMWGWPTMTAEPAGASPGTWLVVTVCGLVLAVVGVVALTALLSVTRGRWPALAALTMVLTGSLLLAPMLGLIALGRSAATRMEQRIGPEAAAELNSRFFDHMVGRWLGLGGLVLLGLGWLAMAAAVLVSRVLSRVDGYLLLCAVAIAGAAAYLSWQFLVTVAAMVLLAAGLGLSWTAFKLGPDGRAPTSG